MKSPLNTLIAAAILVAIFLPASARAQAIVSYADDPTATKYYYQFSTDQDFAAYKIKIKDLTAGTPATATIYPSPAYALGASGNIAGLIPGHTYRVWVYVRWAPGAAWVLEWGPVTFVAA